MAIGILGIGIYLPQQIRTNDWWSNAIIQTWQKEKESIDQELEQFWEDMDDLPQEVRSVLQGLEKTKSDVFEGCKKRHIMDEAEDTVTMECEAAKMAIKNANLSPKDISFVVSQTTLPRSLCEANGFFVHKMLNLSRSCFVYSCTGMCNSFLTQLMLSRQLIENDRNHFGLLLQSSAMSRVVDDKKRVSGLYGDIATAVIVGNSDYGIRAVSTSTYTQLPPLMAIGSPEKAWYENAKLTMYENDPTVGFNTCLWGVRSAKELTEQALNKISLPKEAAQFYATNQGNIWLREVTQNWIGLHNAKSSDTFENYAGLIASNVPLSLYLAYENNQINKGNSIVMYTPGSGLQALCVIADSAI